MTARLHFEIPLAPIGKARPRAVTRGGKTYLYSPVATRVAEEIVRGYWRAAGAVRLTGPVGLEVTVCLPRPARHTNAAGELTAAGRRAPYPTSRPDLDNICKLIADALNGCAWSDDALIADLRARRLWAPRPSVVVEAWELAGEPETYAHRPFPGWREPSGDPQVVLPARGETAA